MYFVTFFQSLIFAAAYLTVKSALPKPFLLHWFFFSLILIGVRIIPRFLDMWIQTNYPEKLLLVELINGTIGSLITAFVLTAMFGNFFG